VKSGTDVRKMQCNQRHFVYQKLTFTNNTKTPCNLLRVTQLINCK